MQKNIDYVLNNLENWNIKSFYLNAYPDEIIYSIILGLNQIRINQKIHDLLLDENFCDSFNKEV